MFGVARPSGWGFFSSDGSELNSRFVLTHFLHANREPLRLKMLQAERPGFLIRRRVGSNPVSVMATMIHQPV
jgi:hypothetical protein